MVLTIASSSKIALPVKKAEIMEEKLITQVR
jgi:hypothetical protein